MRIRMSGLAEQGIHPIVMAGRVRPSTPHRRGADGRDKPSHDGKGTSLAARYFFIRHLILIRIGRSRLSLSLVSAVVSIR